MIIAFIACDGMQRCLGTALRNRRGWPPQTTITLDPER